jgi:hypothetical protein
MFAQTCIKIGVGEAVKIAWRAEIDRLGGCGFGPRAYEPRLSDTLRHMSCRRETTTAAYTSRIHCGE